MPAKPQIDWKLRFKAWWEGGQVNVPKKTFSGGSTTSRIPEKPKIWSANHPEVIQRIWGEGFHCPGGEEFITQFVKPLGLNEAMSVLDLTAGLGGIARSITRNTGAWVTGLEVDPGLAEVGMEMSRYVELHKRASVTLYDPEDFSLDKRFDAVIAREGFFMVKRKNELLSTIAKSMKSRAHFTFTDYVFRHSAGKGEEIVDWREKEPRPPHPWTIAQYIERMKQLKMDIRITEDITDKMRAMILTSFETLPERLPKYKADEATQNLVVEELEVWKNRLHILETGDVRVYRFHVLGPEILENA